MVGILPEDGPLCDQQDSPLPRVVTPLPDPLALALHGLGRARLSAICVALPRLPRRAAVCAATLPGRNTAWSQQEPAHPGTLHCGCRKDRPLRS